MVGTFNFFLLHRIVVLEAPALTENLELHNLVLTATAVCLRRYPANTYPSPMPPNSRHLLQGSLHLSQTVSWSGDW